MTKPAMTKKVRQGTTTDVSPSYADLLQSDTGTPSDALLAVGTFEVDAEPIAVTRYFDPQYAKQEMEAVWKKTWQLAARLEDIPEVGDRITYDVGHLSFVIVRQENDTVKAFYNSCLHRGTKLCADHGGGEHLRCQFHGWTWNLDGSVKEIPGRWDFDGVSDPDYQLPEAKSGVWGGNIFINPDPDAGPMEEALGVLADHFKDYEFEDRWTAVHVRKKFKANWKLAMEAFLEGYHLSETHSQAQSFNGDSSTQYDIWEDEHSQISRSITPGAVPSPELGDGADERQAAIEMIKAVTPAGMPLPDFDKIETIDRVWACEYRRNLMAGMTGRDFSNMSDTDIMDAVQYFMFPNFFPWYAEGAPLYYQFMPYGDDPNLSIMQIRYMLPMPADGNRPPPSPIVELDFDEGFEENDVGFGLFDEVFDQDMANLTLLQEGLKTRSVTTPYIVLGRYQECRIKALHARIERLIEKHPT